jgi:HK97 gp10 family phage protein
MAGITVDDRAFLSSLTAALKQLDRDGEAILHDVGAQVVDKAKSLAPRLKTPDPRYTPGHLAASIGMEAGRDAQGPWIDVGTKAEYALFVEYGTFKDRPQPFMRPAQGLAARAIRSSGGRGRLTGTRARLFKTRAAKRTIIRRALGSGQITGAEARGLSRQVSSTFRFRARRRR